MPLALTGSYEACNELPLSNVLPACPGRALKPETEVTDSLKAAGHVIVVPRLLSLAMLAVSIPQSL